MKIPGLLPGCLLMLALASGFCNYRAAAISPIEIKPIAEFAASLRNAKGEFLKFKERKKLLKQQLQAIRQAPDKTKKQKQLLTLLTILAFIGVVWILGIIGYNGGAGLWPGVGLVISIVLLVIILKKIWRKPKRKN